MCYRCSIEAAEEERRIEQERRRRERAQYDAIAGRPTCPSHSVPEPCPTCSAYIAAGL